MVQFSKLNEIVYTHISIICRKTVDVIENDFPIQIGFMKKYHSLVSQPNYTPDI
jgi:hypothetical protein